MRGGEIEWVPAVVGHGALCSQLWSLRTQVGRGRLWDLCPLRLASRGGTESRDGVGGGGRGPVPSLCPSTLALDPLWAALTRQSLVSSRLYGDHRKDQLGTVVTRFQGLARGSSCGLWGPQSLFPSQWHSLSFELFKNLGVGPQVHDLSLLPNASCCCCC